jgi:putative FmdB family regulatory protein
MPLYEYSCPKCGDFEVLQKVSDAPLKKHDCGKPAARKVSVSSFQLKGGGWYADLYGSKKPAGGTSGDSSSKRSSADSKAA